MINSVVQRKRSFLVSKEWLMIPWTLLPKIPHQVLQDLLMELPGIFEDQDTLPQAAHPSLLARCLDLEARIKAWYGNYISTHPGPPYWLEFSTLNIEPPVFPTRYQFPTIGVANTHTLYWANLVLIHSAIIRLTPASQRSLAAADGIFDLAAQICMAIEYYISPARKSYGPMLALYPLRIATECFKRMGPRGEKSTLWCKAVFKILEERGIALGAVVEEILWESKEAERVWGVKGWAGRMFWERMEEGWIESAGAGEQERRIAQEVGGGNGI